MLTKVFQQYDTLWKYYRSGATALDQAYFLREFNDWPLMPLSADYDEKFCTCGDGQLAELIGSELLMQYIDKLLHSPVKQETQENRSIVSSQLICTDTPTNIVELGYALYARGFLTRVRLPLER